MAFLIGIFGLFLLACLIYWWARAGVIPALMLTLALVAPLTASARAEVTCQHVGSFTYCSDGSSYQHVGNFTYGSDGTTYQHIDGFTYGPNHTVNQRVGDFTYGPGRSTCQHVGDFSYGPNGSACQ